LKVEEYIIKSHNFCGHIDQQVHITDDYEQQQQQDISMDNKNSGRLNIKEKKRGKRRRGNSGKKSRRRGSAVIKKPKKCPLFPLMKEMDCVYWNIMTDFNKLDTPQKDSKREVYYSLICMTLWRYISYYGVSQDKIPLVPYVSFVSGLLYILSKEGLNMGENNQMLPCDEYLKQALPTMKDLSWRPKRKKIDGDLLAIGLQKKGSNKKQTLIKGFGGGSGRGGPLSSSNRKIPGNIKSNIDMKMLDDTFNAIQKNRLSHSRKHSEWDDDGDYDGDGLGGTNNDENLLLSAYAMKNDLSEGDDDPDHKVKSVHQHKHGDREDLSVGKTALFFRRRKRSKKLAKYKKQEEPPSWRPLGAIHYDKEVDEDTSMKHIFSFGNRGRLYNNAIVSQGKRYIKDNLNEMSRDPQKVKGLKASLRQVYFIKSTLL
jgi:hypothetical protein